MEKSNIIFKATKAVVGASTLWSWRVGIESNGRVCIVICFPAHPHAHMLTHYLPSSTLPQAPLTSPFDDVVKGAWPHGLTRRWQHNGFKADVQNSDCRHPLTYTHPTPATHTHTHTLYTQTGCCLPHALILPPLRQVMCQTWKCHCMNQHLTTWMHMYAFRKQSSTLLYTKYVIMEEMVMK